MPDAAGEQGWGSPSPRAGAAGWVSRVPTPAELHHCCPTAGRESSPLPCSRGISPSLTPQTSVYMHFLPCYSPALSLHLVPPGAGRVCSPSTPPPLGDSCRDTQQPGALTPLFRLRQQSHHVAWCSGYSQQTPTETQLFCLATSLAGCQGLRAAEQRMSQGVILTAGRTSLTSNNRARSSEPASDMSCPTLAKEAKRQFLSAHWRSSQRCSSIPEASQETSSAFHILFKQFPFLLLSGSEDHDCIASCNRIQDVLQF